MPMSPSIAVRFTAPAPRLASLAMLLAIAIGTVADVARADGLPPMMLLQRVPAGAIEIAEAMRTAKPGQDIVIRGRVTEGNDVFVANRAIMRLADEAAMPACCAPGSHASNTACSVPANRRATIQFLDTRDRLIRLGLRGLHGLTVGKEVFIVGTVLTADNDRTLIVNASGMHVPTGDIPVGLMVSDAPEGAVPVGEARPSAEVGGRVVIRGRVGGETTPLGDGRATMTLIDPSIGPCADADCRTPWAACNTPREVVAAHSARIVVTDERGEPVRTDLRGRRGITELSTVTVAGIVASTADGGLVVRATAIHVE